MAPMVSRFADVGASEDSAKLWFASLLRDGFALTAAARRESSRCSPKGRCAPSWPASRWTATSTPPSRTS
jgi:hypothetical protein